jgi:hypothetical protein
MTLTIRQLEIVTWLEPDTHDKPLALVKLTADGHLKVVSPTICNAQLRTEQRQPKPWITIPTQVLDYTRTPKGRVTRTVDFAHYWEDILIAQREGHEIHFAVSTSHAGQVPPTWPTD